MLKDKQEAVNTNFKVIVLTEFGIELESSAPEAGVLSTRHFVGSITCQFFINNDSYLKIALCYQRIF